MLSSGSRAGTLLICVLMAACSNGGGDSGSSGGACGSASSGSLAEPGGTSTFDVVVVNNRPNQSVLALRIIDFLDVNDGPDRLAGNDIPACTRFTLTLQCSNYASTQRVAIELSNSTTLVDPAVDFDCGTTSTYQTD